MLGSHESMISLPDLSFPKETNVISLDCWQDICLSKIWIPSHLLKSRTKPSNAWETQGIFHTLTKRGHAKQIDSFNVYNSDSENENELFLTDSDDDFTVGDIGNDEEKEIPQKLVEKDEETNISLHELLNCTTEVDINNFDFKKDHNYRNKEIESLQSSKRNKNVKKKKKIAKSVTLDQFLEDYTEEDKQEDYANDYLRKLYMSQNRDDQVQIKSNSDFPDLSSKEIQFIRNENPVEEKSKVSLKTLAEILSPSDTNCDEKNTNCAETTLDSESALGKIVIENIPLEASHEDIFTLLCGYGEVKNFSLEPDGDFFKAFVEIDLVGDIDWIVECLNGTDAFGASSRLLKCYKQ